MIYCSAEVMELVVILIHSLMLFICSIMRSHLSAVLLSLHLTGDLFAPSKINGITGAHLLHILGCTSAYESANVGPVSSSGREINHLTAFDNKLEITDEL